jgi:DNA-directed RNA polymerase specialized sigma24 family protein
MFEFEKELEILYVDGYIQHVAKVHVHRTKVGYRIMEVEDLAHETYIRCILKQHLYTHNTLNGFKAWVSMVCRHWAMNHRRIIYGRSCIFETYIEDQSMDESTEPGNRGFYRLLLEQVEGRIKQSDFELLRMLADGYSHREIAELKGIPQPTVSSFSRRWRGGPTWTGRLEERYGRLGH